MPLLHPGDCVLSGARETLGVLVTAHMLPAEIALAVGLSEDATTSPSPQGMTSEVSFVDDRGRTAVLKRCRDPRYIEWLRREHAVLVALAGSSVAMPRPLGYHEALEGGRATDAWLLMTRLPGESLWDVLLRATPGERRRLISKVGELLRHLHAIPAPLAFDRQPSWIDRVLEKARHNLPWCDGSAELLAHLEAMRPAPVAEAVIHGDMALDNVLVDDHGTLRLIDWSGGDFGDPRYDVALALATDPEIVLDDAALGAFFDGYAGPRIDSATMRWFRDLYEFF